MLELLKNSGSGEPGFYFTNDKEYGVNPCCEIALKPYQFCNLTSINAASIESQEDLNQRAKAAAFVGTLQASYTDYHYLRPEWKKITEKEALLGVSLTGLSSINHHEFNWKEAAEAAVDENKRVAELLNINPARRVTCIKPEGTGSLVLGTSSGIHSWHNTYYKRRIRVGKNEAIYSYLQNTLPELVEDEVYGRNAVITIPIKSPNRAITRDEDVVDFMERIKFFSENWVNPGHSKGTNTHNVSATVSVKDDDWGRVASWLWKNQDSFNGLSFLPYDNGTYIQAPFEDCTEDDYNELTKYIKEVDLTDIIEEVDDTTLQSELACSGGSCEVI
jgi:ribonucleoside-diphosphate reductase alpha chain